MKKRILLPVLIISILLSACQGTKPTEQSLDTITMTISHNLGDSPIFIAEAEGFFEEFGIKINYVEINQTTEAVALLASGDIDVYSSAFNTGIINIISQDPTIKVVADRGHSLPGECTYLGLAIRKDLFESGAVTSPADLKGLTFSANSSGTTGIFLSEYLAQGGLTRDDVNYEKLPQAAYLDALKNKSIDGILTIEPMLTALYQDGNSVLLAGIGDVFDVFQIGVVIFGRKLTTDDPDLGARFMAAYLKGVSQFNEGKTDRNIEILVENSGQSQEIVKESCWTSIRQDGSIDFNGIDPFQIWSIENGYLDKGVTEEQLYDPSFLEAARVLLDQ